jgi:hypothetical protein
MINSDSIIGINKIMNAIDLKKLRNKVFDESKRRSVLFDKESVDRYTDKRCKDLKSFRNSLKVLFY